MFIEYTKSKRCQCYNITNKICNNRQRKFYIYKMKRVCTVHFKILFEIVALVIQKTYRGYKCRKALNCFYNRLPDDVQYKIKYFINEQLYLKKFNNNLKIVINIKLNNFINNYFNLFNDENIDINYMLQQLEKYLLDKDEIIDSYKLFIKYYGLTMRPIWINMRLLWYRLSEYHDIVKEYYLINNINNNEVLSKLLKIQDKICKIKYYFNTEPHFMLFI